MRIIVCGGRAYTDARTVAKTLAGYATSTRVFHRLVHGGAPGADTMAAAVAYTLGWSVEEHSVDWGQHGNAAGPIRNQAMADLGADLLLAFPGGRGTADMIRRATAAGIPVRQISRERP